MVNEHVFMNLVSLSKISALDNLKIWLDRACDLNQYHPHNLIYLV